MTNGCRRRLLDLLLAVLVAGGAFGLYARTLAPTVLAGDGGEFQFVPYLLGVAHPTGYPLYSLLGWAWSRLLPVGDVAYRMNLFSAFWAALAVGLLVPTAGTLLRRTIAHLSPLVRRLIAVLTAVTFAVTPTLWSQAVVAEVYGLHIFFLVLLLYLLLVWAERRDPRLLLLAAGCFGLGLAHHSTTLLLAPSILAYLWLSDRRVYRDRALILKGLLALLLPLALYLYLPWRAPHTPYLRLPLTEARELVLYDNTPAGLLHFVLGGPFGGYVDLSVDLGARVAMAWGFLLEEIGWIGLTLSLVGLARLVLTRHWPLLALTALSCLAVVAFNLVYTIGDIYVLYIPVYLIMNLWMAVGAGAIASSVRRPIIAVPLVTLLFALPLWMVSRHYADVDQSQNTGARTRWTSILAEPIPPDAVLISNDRNDIMPMWYYQYVDGKRPDLLGLYPLITPDYPTLGHLLDLALSTGRPVYLSKEMPGVEVEVEVESEGTLWRVVEPAANEEPAYPRDDRLAGAVALAGYDRSPRSPRPGEALQVSLYWQALRPLEAKYHTFVHLLDNEGQVVAQSDRQPGGVYYPTSHWRPGERLRDEHTLTLPADAQEGIYRLLVGMYSLSSDGALRPLGEPIVAGQVAVKGGVQTKPEDIGHAVGANFGDLIALLGYESSVQDGTLATTLHWRSLGAPSADYTVFVHLLDASGKIIAQQDGQPQGGTYPTSLWDVGEVVADEHLLPLPPGLPAGEYRLRVGLYLLETGERLSVKDGGDSIDLGPLDVGD